MRAIRYGVKEINDHWDVNESQSAMRAIRYGEQWHCGWSTASCGRNPLCVQLDMEYFVKLGDRLLRVCRNPLCVQLDMEWRKINGKGKS